MRLGSVTFPKGPVDFKYITAGTRAHNAQNQITGIGGQTTATYDCNGNTKRDDIIMKETGMKETGS